MKQLVVVLCALSINSALAGSSLSFGGPPGLAVPAKPAEGLRGLFKNFANQTITCGPANYYMARVLADGTPQLYHRSNSPNWQTPAGLTARDGNDIRVTVTLMGLSVTNDSSGTLNGANVCTAMWPF